MSEPKTKRGAPEEPGREKPRETIDTVELESRLASRLRKREKDALWLRRFRSLQRKRRR